MRSLFVLLSCFIGLATMAQTVDFTSNRVCYGQLTTLTGSSSLNDTAIASWTWDLNNDGVFGDQTGKVINFAFANDQLSPASLKIIPNVGNADSVTNDVWVNPVPDVNFNVDNACADQAAHFISTSTINSGTITQYQWDVYDDNIIDDNSGDNIYFTIGPAQTYTTTLICISDSGCSAFATKTTEVFPVPVADYAVSNPCVNEATVFQNSSSLPGDSIAFYLWTFGDGVVDVTDWNAAHVYDTAGTYSSSLVAVSAHNCADTLVVPVTVYELPNVALSYSSGDTVIVGDVPLEITVTGNADTYLWSTSETTVSISVTDPGYYTVAATDVNGCTRTLEANITFSEGGVNVLNDLLTPNADGFNDYLMIENLDVYDNCEVVIYNRWNDIVFQTSSYNNDWDGTYNGSPLAAGTYFYVIKCSGEESVTGSINILR